MRTAHCGVSTYHTDRQFACRRDNGDLLAATVAYTQEGSTQSAGCLRCGPGCLDTQCPRLAQRPGCGLQSEERNVTRNGQSPSRPSALSTAVLKMEAGASQGTLGTTVVAGNTDFIKGSRGTCRFHPSYRSPGVPAAETQRTDSLGPSPGARHLPRLGISGSARPVQRHRVRLWPPRRSRPYKSA